MATLFGTNLLSRNRTQTHTVLLSHSLDLMGNFLAHVSLARARADELLAFRVPLSSDKSVRSRTTILQLKVNYFVSTLPLWEIASTAAAATR